MIGTCDGPMAASRTCAEDRTMSYERQYAHMDAVQPSQLGLCQAALGGSQIRGCCLSAARGGVCVGAKFTTSGSDGPKKEEIALAASHS